MQSYQSQNTLGDPDIEIKDFNFIGESKKLRPDSLSKIFSMFLRANGCPEMTW
jgi:hypothetical protein